MINFLLGIYVTGFVISAIFLVFLEMLGGKNITLVGLILKVAGISALWPFIVFYLIFGIKKK